MIALAAMSKNRTIGLNGKLPWHLLQDLIWFKKFTIGKKIVMGRKTFESVGVLPQREIYVLTTKPTKELRVLAKAKKIKIIKKINRIPKDSIICGGAEIYTQTLELCSDLFLTFIDKVYEGDTFFPYFEDDFMLANVMKQEVQDGGPMDGVQFEFRHYVNKLINRLELNE
jgi:dihydrofolate reductase